MAPPTTTSTSENSPTVHVALQELQTQLSQETSHALGEAHHELAKLLLSEMSGLDSMTPTQLKIRFKVVCPQLQQSTATSNDIANPRLETNIKDLSKTEYCAAHLVGVLVLLGY